MRISSLKSNLLWLYNKTAQVIDAKLLRTLKASEKDILIAAGRLFLSKFVSRPKICLSFGESITLAGERESFGGILR